MTRFFAVAFLLLLPLTAAAQHAPAHRPQAAPPEFTASVNAYVEIHRRTAAGLAPDALCSDPEELVRQQHRFATAIRDARQGARAGDIFTPTVASFFRAHIARVVHHLGPDVSWTGDGAADAESGHAAAALDVNAPLPWAPGSETWPELLWQLPPLPEEIEYRVVGPDLVLLDIRAGLVVDILENAVPAVEPRAASPCTAHPDLPACWM